MDCDWSKIELLGVDEHVHLDECVDTPPAPGDLAWLDLIQDVIRHLEQISGRWMITMPLGHISHVPDMRAIDPQSLAASATTVELFEPPAVHRLPRNTAANLWAGEQHSRDRLIGPAVLEVCSVARDEIDLASGEPFAASVAYEISPRATDSD